jgi:hypothetical protein
VLLSGGVGTSTARSRADTGDFDCPGEVPDQDQEFTKVPAKWVQERPLGSYFRGQPPLTKASARSSGDQLSIATDDYKGANYLP